MFPLVATNQSYIIPVQPELVLFLFLKDATVPTTNNSSEQAIRMSVIFRRVTNGFCSELSRNLFAAVRSVVNTGKRQGLTAYQFIQQALSIDGSIFYRS